MCASALGHEVSTSCIPYTTQPLIVILTQVLQHGGALPGLISPVTFLSPSQSSLAGSNFISNWIILDVLGMMTLDQPFTDSNYIRLNSAVPLADFKTSPCPSQQFLTTAPPELPIEAFAGTYTDPGYGIFFAPHLHPRITRRYPTLQRSSLIPHHLGNSSCTLLGQRSGRVTFERFLEENNSFLFSFLAMYPEGFGKGASPFYDGTFQLDVHAEFEVRMVW